jgi:UDP-3-O-[3-hydroxymyristoyl] glucosamine N-acyltransferase
MFKVKSPELYASEIAEFLNLRLEGTDFLVHAPCSPVRIRDESFLYLSETDVLPEDQMSRHHDVLVLSSKSFAAPKGRFSVIISKNPKLDFIRVVNEFFIEFDRMQIAGSAKIHSEARLGKNVSVGEHCVIGPEVVIGNNTRLFNNVVVTGRVDIGKDCVIKDNATIGSEGYDFELDESGRPLHCPHMGLIKIGNRVWIGANSSIESAALDDTVIGDGVKIDDLVQIGYNSEIGAGCMVTAGVIVSRYVKIGEGTWLAPNASIRERITIGKNALIGTGAVVVGDVEDGVVAAGNPAKTLRRRT